MRQSVIMSIGAVIWVAGIALAFATATSGATPPDFLNVYVTFGVAVIGASQLLQLQVVQATVLLLGLCLAYLIGAGFILGSFIIAWLLPVLGAVALALVGGGLVNLAQRPES